MCALATDSCDSQLSRAVLASTFYELPDLSDEDVSWAYSIPFAVDVEVGSDMEPYVMRVVKALIFKDGEVLIGIPWTTK